MQPPLFDLTPPILSVSAVTQYIRERLESDPGLQDLWLEGEISNWRQAASGHIYFTLKDDRASIRCIIWRATAQRLAYRPQGDGEAILAHGRVGVYEAGGSYQLYVDDLEPVGHGALYLEFERLKRRLEEEGLFDETRKRPLPMFPQRIGLVTSRDAAALRDILNVLARRYPLAELILAPTPVQGEEAPLRIVQALEAIARFDVDVVLLARGGGSLEDLWAFNDERVARAVAACPVPVVTGVGHETDFTIADFVADQRAPTPSAAAELVSPDRAQWRRDVESLGVVLAEAARDLLADRQTGLDQLRWALDRLSPQSLIDNRRQRLDDLASQARRSLDHRLSLQGEQLNGLRARLATLDPRATLDRGYAVVQKDGTVVTKRNQVAGGDTVRVTVSDGDFEADVRA
jgi:exodeoxyribonuclease VII large subunit